MTSSDRQTITLDEAVEIVRTQGGWRTFAQIQTLLVSSGVPLDEATMDRLSGAFVEWRKAEDLRYENAIREAVRATPNAPADTADLSDWVGSLDPDRLGARSFAFHEASLEIVLRKLASADDSIAAGFRYTTSLEVLQKAAAKVGDLALIVGEQGTASALESELGKHLREVLAYLVSVYEPARLANGKPREDPLSTAAWDAARAREVREVEDKILWLDAWFASYVERFGDAGRELAGRIRSEAKERWPSRDSNPFETFVHWLPEGNPSIRAPRVVRNLALVVWLDVVGPRLLRDRKKRLEPVRMSTDLSKTFAIARASGGHSEGGAIQVVPPSGVALMLPFDEDLKVTRRGGDTVSLRQVLSPNALRTYLATLVLFQDAGMRDDGSFEFEGPGAILDVTGAKKHEERKGTRTYARYATKDTKAVLEHLATFTKVRVRVVGDLEAAVGDALLDEISDRRNGKVVTYAHARLIAARLKHDYLRLPRAVCKLAPSDVPLGMGIATIVRAKVLANLRNGAPIEQPLEQWLEACGIDGHEGARKEGRAYWRSVVDDLTRVADEGRLGEMRSAGAGRDAVLTLTLHSDLSASYRPLLESSKAHERAKVSARIVSHRKRMK